MVKGVAYVVYCFADGSDGVFFHEEDFFREVLEGVVVRLD